MNLLKLFLQIKHNRRTNQIKTKTDKPVELLSCITVINNQKINNQKLTSKEIN